MTVVPILATAMSIWLVILMFAPKTSSTGEIVKAPLPITKVFDLKTASDRDYSNFIVGLRNELKDPRVSYYGVPMLPAPSTDAYIYIELRSYDQEKKVTNSIKLGIDRNNVYVVGYSSSYKGQVRARFLNDAPTYAKEKLFPEVTASSLRTKNIGFTGQYKSIQGVANTNRKDLELGKPMLEEYINDISQTDVNDKGFAKLEAKFFLIAIQTVSEAVRFEYIKEVLRANYYEKFKPDPQVINLEENWDKISTGIVNNDVASINKAGLVHANGKPRTINKIEDIIGDMGLLLYIKPSSNYAQWPITEVVNNVTVSG